MRRRFDEDLPPYNSDGCDGGVSVGLCERAGDDDYHNADGKYAVDCGRLLTIDKDARSCSRTALLSAVPQVSREV